MSKEPEFGPIALSLIKPSKLNPRKNFDGLEKLVASVKERGVLQPIILRPLAKQGYEIVAGERRFRAAKAAGLDGIPARVIECTDEEAANIRLVENDQREDISPLERAAAYQERIDAGVSVEGLANTVGKSVSTVRDALQLSKCPEKLSEAVAEGRVSGSVASLVCRIPADKLRNKISLYVLAGETWWRNGEAPRVSADSRPLSYRQTQEFIAKHAMIELKGAPFDPADANLVPSAGACAECPHRLGNARKLEPEVYVGGRDDLCLNPECYRTKTEAASSKSIDVAKQEGRKVLSATECKKIFAQESYEAPETLNYTAPWIRLDATFEHGSQRTARSVLKKELENGLAPKIAIGIDRSGRAWDLLPIADAAPALKEHGIKVRIHSERNGGSNDDWNARWKKQQAAHARKQKIEKAFMSAAVDKIVEATRSVAGRVPLLRLLAKELAPYDFSVAGQRLRHLKKIKSFDQYIDKLEGDALWGFLAIGLFDSLYSQQMTCDDKARLAVFGELLGCDFEELRKQTEKEHAPAKKAKGKKGKAMAGAA